MKNHFNKTVTQEKAEKDIVFQINLEDVKNQVPIFLPLESLGGTEDQIKKKLRVPPSLL